MPPCIFCDILAGKAPASFVFQDELCAAFMDIHPVNPGHVLVVPHRHAELLTMLDLDSAGRMMQVALIVDAALRRSDIPCEGVNLFLADGRIAGQEVPHVHLHVIPRYHGDGHHLRFSPAYFTTVTEAKLEKVAKMICAHMEINQ